MGVRVAEAGLMVWHPRINLYLTKLIRQQQSYIVIGLSSDDGYKLFG